MKDISELNNRHSYRDIIIHAYTDGSCWNTLKQHPLARIGGIGVVLIVNDHKSLERIEVFEGQFHNTTSFRMEVRAVIKALELSPLNSQLNLFCDNKAIVDILKTWNVFSNGNQEINEQWYGENSDLFSQLKERYVSHHKAGTFFVFHWIKGHSGVHFNEAADKLAKRGRLHGNKTIQCRKALTRK